MSYTFPLADAICELCKQPAYLHKQFSWTCPGAIGWLEGFYFTDNGVIPITETQKTVSGLGDKP